MSIITAKDYKNKKLPDHSKTVCPFTSLIKDTQMMNTITKIIKFQRIVCDICNGVCINLNAASFRLAPRKLASCRSLPERSQN